MHSTKGTMTVPEITVMQQVDVMMYMIKLMKEIKYRSGIIQFQNTITENIFVTGLSL